MLYAFGRLGLIGRYLEAAGISIAFSTAAVVLAQTFVSLPYLVISRGCSPHRRSRLRGGGGDTWGAARHCLVARDPAVAAPGRGVGSVLAFARSLGEFGAT